jgi:hypothetical protein
VDSGSYESVDRILRSARPRTLRRNVTMRAADECHPLPDQLHPCSRFSWFSWYLVTSLRSMTSVLSQEDRCVSRRLRSLQRGMTCFCKSRSVRSRRLVPFASPVSSPASVVRFSRFKKFGAVLEKGRDRFCFRSREETNSLRSEIRFPRCELELSSLFRSRRLRHRDPRKRVHFALCRLGRAAR